MERRDFDDCDFASLEEELFDTIHPAPRIVFGGVPTLQEAKEATTDLKDTIDMIHFSPNSAKQSVGYIQGSTSSENSVVIPEVLNAFSLLQGSPEAQVIVLSSLILLSQNANEDHESEASPHTGCVFVL